MTEIHQFIHSYVDHDAVGTHTRHLQRVIRAMGIRSEIYADEWRGTKSKASAFREFRTDNATDDTWLMYQLATASPMVEFLQSRTERVAVNYHNFTPSELIGPWEPAIGAEVDYARRQMAELAPSVDVAFGVSQFNERELRAAGYANTATVPILFDPADFEHALDQKLDAELQKQKALGGSDWLFVGRVAPHKCQHDIIKAFAIYQKTFDPQARLHIVGGVSSHLYYSSLKKFINILQLNESVNLAGGVSDGALGAYYRNADVFVCLSEHEGFGVPLLEAMHHGVPVVAYDAAAIGETLGTGGLLLQDKTSGTVATAVERVRTDEQLRLSLVKSGAARLADFSLAKTEAKWREAIQSMVSAGK